MSLEKNRIEKLEQAKIILKALGLPKQQYNNRSAWVFLALADIKPTSKWKNVKSPMLPTVAIMEFIRVHYGQDYKPNSRETIRRQTLHQFEQARIVDRNRDDPNRPTNSKDNNYSLNIPIVEILKEFPDGKWEDVVKKYKKNLTNLRKMYEKQLDLKKIPITLPSGHEIKLSPGKHNKLQADIIHEFCPRFIGGSGVLLYMGDTASSRNEGGKLMFLEEDFLNSLGVPPMSHEKLPDIVVIDKKKQWLFLIEAVTSHGPVSPKRWTELEIVLIKCTVGRVYVSAFPNRDEFRRNAADIAWETEVWIADNPDHLIHFNGDRFLGPHR